MYIELTGKTPEERHTQFREVGADLIKRGYIDEFHNMECDGIARDYTKCQGIGIYIKNKEWWFSGMRRYDTHCTYEDYFGLFDVFS